MKRKPRKTFDWGDHWFDDKGDFVCKGCGRQFDLPVIHVPKIKQNEKHKK